MRTLARLCLWTLFFVFSVSATAQNLKQLYKNAEGYFYNENPRDALKRYEKILAVDPNYEDAAYKAEMCLLLTGDVERPLENILEFRDTQGKSDKFYYYWLGKILVYRYMFEDAVVAWEQFLKLDAYKSEEIVAETKIFIEDTKDKIKVFQNQSKYQVVKLGSTVNTDEAELTPTYIPQADELLFAAVRGGTTKHGDLIFNIYRMKKTEGEWGKPALVPSFGDFEEHTANLELVNEDGKLFMFKEHKGGDLFYSELVNDRWTAPVEFDSKISNTHFGSHFYINEHEDRIVYSTDRNYNQRGLDIYQSYRDAETGKWSKPAPFTEVINTDFNEDSPFLSTDENTLYFSSDGHQSIGGYDVFKSTFDEETSTWSEPVNLGYPVNTPDDEIQFKISVDGDGGFLCSNRLKPRHDYDIYQFYEADWIKIEGKVYDLFASAPVKGGELEFTSTDLAKEHFYAAIDSMGSYQARVVAERHYDINIRIESEVVHQEKFLVHAEEHATLHLKNFHIGQEEVGESTLAERIASDDPTRYQAYEKSSTELSNLASKYRKAQKAILNNIYFDFGTSHIKPESNDVMRMIFALMNGSSNLKIEIAGHTDNVGTDDSNQQLSQKRAEEVKKTLVGLGVAADRMVAKGYGSSQPIASNDNERDGRELNRRIEILVLQ